MRTPWKTLHDVDMAVNDLDIRDPGYDIQSLLYGLFVVLPLFLGLAAVQAAMNFVAPPAKLTRLLNENFFATFAILWGAFFFYSFFRMVWDGLKEPTVPSPTSEQNNG